MKHSDRITAEGILYTDQYQLTMAQLYFRMGLHEKHAQFDHFFRNYPDYGGHKAGYCVNAGIHWLLEWMKEARFRKKDIQYLRSQKGISGKKIFHEDFLEWLSKYGAFDGISIKAIPEGRVVHPEEPVTIVQGPMAMAQILETPLLNFLNYQILIATKAARIRESAGDQLILEFGLRRGHERGANAGIRSALIGGADFSSGVGISHVLGFQPKGTHAHSMVQAFMALGEGELGAFRAYSELYPDDCLLLVDTVNTLKSGIPNAIRVFEELRRKGHKPFGIRLDSGNLAYLSIRAARMLDAAGFPDTVIVLSNQLDELSIREVIDEIKRDGRRHGVDADLLIKRLVFGVGTRLITSAGYSALDGVYKLTTVRDKGTWIPAIKISESAGKVINPGKKQAWRLYDNEERAMADILAEESEDLSGVSIGDIYHPTNKISRLFKQERIGGIEPLLEDIMRDGVPVSDQPSIDDIREKRKRDVERLDPGVRRLVNPNKYPVLLSERLRGLKKEMIDSTKGKA